VQRRAVQYRDDGRYAEADPLFQQALEGYRRELGPDHSETLECMHDLGFLYKLTGRYAEGEVVVRQVLEALRRKLGSDHPGSQQYQADTVRTADGLALLGLNLLGQKKATDAEKVLHECLAMREKMEPDSWQVFNARSLLGEALVRQERYAEAEALLRTGYEGLKQHQEEIPAAAHSVPLKEAVQRLVQLYDACGKSDEAARWRKVLETAGRSAAPRE
jgi:tetratricopeptide (TPR) repeat protein